ncbi:hypothetical protein SBA1_500039 [Candidatus Sulfotelmatobacter kueseliae]|uniref:Uncharacterized protein n=1 Tax=Candidatus Sulfotelmatobacter kueseliae TaxID=2042962 RepID=A0A2U3KW82_9BACT|nr:hypothetical protein SBA1_500039 [Candidatus Sulfotelmatobacter kueseliae]
MPFRQLGKLRNGATDAVFQPIETLVSEPFDHLQNLAVVYSLRTLLVVRSAPRRRCYVSSPPPTNGIRVGRSTELSHDDTNQGRSNCRNPGFSSPRL